MFPKTSRIDLGDAASREHVLDGAAHVPHCHFCGYDRPVFRRRAAISGGRRLTIPRRSTR
jgi:hypothetical protein